MDSTRDAVARFVDEQLAGLTTPPFDRLVARKRALLRRRIASASAATAVAAIAVAATVVITAPSTKPPTKGSLAAGNPAPATRAYSYRGVALELPASWSVDPTACAVPLTPYVYTAGFSPYCKPGPGSVGSQTDQVRFSSLSFDSASVAAARTAANVAGHQILTGTLPRASTDRVVVVTSRDVLVRIHVAEPDLAKRIITSISFPATDASGCPTSEPATTDTTTAETRITPLPVATPLSASVCQYSQNLLQDGSRLTSHETAAAADAIGRLHQGLGPVIANRDCPKIPQSFAIILLYDRAKIVMRVDADGCRPLGVTLGNAHYGYDVHLRELLAVHAGRGANLADGR